MTKENFIRLFEWISQRATPWWSSLNYITPYRHHHVWHTCGLTILGTVSSRLWNAWYTHMDVMALLSIHRNSNSAKIWSIGHFCWIWNPKESVCPCQRYLNAICDFQTPQNITDMRSSFGLNIQIICIIQKSLFDQPLLRQIVCFLCYFSTFEAGNPFTWSKTVKELIGKTGHHPRNKGMFEIFDKNKFTCIATD